MLDVQDIGAEATTEPKDRPAAGQTSVSLDIESMTGYSGTSQQLAYRAIGGMGGRKVHAPATGCQCLRDHGTNALRAPAIETENDFEQARW